MLAWHVVNEDFTLNYDLKGTKVYPGLELEYKGELSLCESGLHASFRLLDALSYGNSCVICRVEIGENYIEDTDKVVSDYRKVIAVKDCTRIIQETAIEIAYDVLGIFEEKYPNDMRPKEALIAAEKYLKGEISQEKLDAAARAAADAADAAYAAARAAAYAAYAAADAAYAAADAAYAAAARAAADAAAYAADAYEKYNGWLETKIKQYLEVG